MNLDTDCMRYIYREGEDYVFNSLFLAADSVSVVDDKRNIKKMDDWSKERLIRFNIPDSLSVNDIISHYKNRLDREHEIATSALVPF